MQFRLLGPLEARDGDRILALGGPKQRTLLAHLLLQPNRIVTAERLIDALWGDSPPETARNTLQTYVKHLRKAVGSGRIRHRSAGYLLEAEPIEVDALHFQALVEEARCKIADLPGAAAALREALDLWRGPALDDLADQPSLRPEIARLEEVRLAAIEKRIEIELALGRHHELVPELESLIQRNPYQERLWGQLMVALYRSGRQGDALNAFRRARDVLQEELGIDPSNELHRLQEQVLKQDPALEVGIESLRGYRLLKQIGEGPLGTVHRAFQPEVGREVAIKIVPSRLANDPGYIRRFDAEAQLIAQLEHPYIVSLYDYWREPDGAYLVMRYLRGGSLREALAYGPLDTDRTLRMVDQVAQALAMAHRQGVVHGDVKPANILFDEDGNAYLSDFAIGKDLAVAQETSPADASSPFAWSLSPEEVRAEPLTDRADIYGLGLVLYECLTGHHPFAGATPDQLPDQYACQPIPSIRTVRADLPTAIDEVIARATNEDPAERYPDVIAFAAASQEALTAAPALARVVETEARNPYKGLRAFTEADAGDFFGREIATRELLARMQEEDEGSRFIAVVGPSGSGKSSLVRAGLVPALRAGALAGSEAWFIVDLLPGGSPFAELDATLVRIAVDPRPDLMELLARDANGLVRVAEEILPPGGSELLLVIDQFEEVFTLVDDEDVRARFLDAILTATTDPRSRVRVVVTLRADFYDRPLLYRGFGELLASRTHAVTPLSVSDLERAVVGPAESVRVRVEPRLVGEVVAEVADRPGALPLLEYALTELFDARHDSSLTLESYGRLGGVSGALARRAEDLYEALDDAAKEAARQLFFRLVGLGDRGSEDTRRRVARAELTSVEVDPGAMETVIDAFGAHRLLSFDRDPETRGPTVEVAHETLLSEWGRLRGWIESGREEIRLHARLSAATNEWLETGRSDDYLLQGRLTEVEAGTRASSIKLSEREREYVEASVAAAEGEATAERERQAREALLERRAFRRMRALVAVLAAASLVAASLTVVAVNRSREAERRRVEAILSAEHETVARLSAASVASLDTDPELSLRLALYSVGVTAGLGEPVPVATVEAIHWALQEAGVQYPVSDAPVAVVDGPLGPRGVYDLPLLTLLDLAREHAGQPLSVEQCEQYFGGSECPPLPSRFSSDLRADPIRAVGPGVPGRSLAGTRVTIWNGFTQTWQAGFRRELKGFTARTGIAVDLAGLPNFEAQLAESVVARDPPDIAMLLQPGSVASLAQEGPLMDLGTYIDTERLARDQSPYLVSLGSVGPDGSWPSTTGGTYGAFTDLHLKSLIWYPVPEFLAAGYEIPGTWEELIAVSDRLVADGRTPWCIGFESGSATGWPGTDWIENLVLARAGPEIYDRWTFHEIPFDNAAVRDAFDRLGQIVFGRGYLHRGRVGARETYFEEAQLPMVTREPPGCWFHMFPTFGTSYLPEGMVGVETDAFPFPIVTERSVGGMVVGGNMAIAFADRPEVREVVRFLLGPSFGAEWAGRGQGFVSANRRFDLENYPPFWARQAELLHEALAADTVRFDGSDLMPPEVGLWPFWDALMEYLAEGTDSLDRIVADLEAAWPDDG